MSSWNYHKGYFSIIAFIAKENNPRDNIVIGKDKSWRTGLTKEFNIPKKRVSTIKLNAPEIYILGSI